MVGESIGGQVTWPEFLDYFKGKPPLQPPKCLCPLNDCPVAYPCILYYLSITSPGVSLGVDDDDYFELMIRNALKPAPNSSGGISNSYDTTHPISRRVLVVHSNGSEEVIGESTQV